jgi:hypothetical protein
MKIFMDSYRYLEIHEIANSLPFGNIFQHKQIKFVKCRVAGRLKTGVVEDTARISVLPLKFKSEMTIPEQSLAVFFGSWNGVSLMVDFCRHINEDELKTFTIEMKANRRVEMPISGIKLPDIGDLPFYFAGEKQLLIRKLEDYLKVHADGVHVKEFKYKFNINETEIEQLKIEGIAYEDKNKLFLL